MKKFNCILFLVVLLGLVLAPIATAYVGTVFSDDFEDDVAYDDGPYNEPGAWQNGPPVNEGKPGRWLSGLWTIDSRFPDQNWNINVVKNGAYVYYWSDPVDKPGKELFYNVRNLQNFSNADPELYDGFNRDGFGKFTDAAGNPVRAVAGQTLRGSFKMCRLAQMPAFALTTNIDALVASTALEPNLTDIYGVYKYPYSTLQHYVSGSEKWDPNVACILAMGQGTKGLFWFNAIVPKIPSQVPDGGITNIPLDSQTFGDYLAFPDYFTDKLPNRAYQEVYFEYTVGNPTFDVLQVDGRDIHVWEKNIDGVYVETPNSVPAGNYLGAAENGIDGFVLGHIRAETNGYAAFYDDFHIEIVKLDADLDGDMYVDSSDLQAFVGEWLTSAAPTTVVAFDDDFDDDVADDVYPYESGPPTNSGKSGRWISGQWTFSQDVTWTDYNWNISVVNGIVDTWTTWGSPIDKSGNEAYFAMIHSDVAPEPPYDPCDPCSVPDVWNVAGFAAFTDSAGNPITAEVGQTLKGSFKFCILNGIPVFALTNDIEAMAAKTADLTPVETWATMPGLLEGLTGWSVTDPIDPNLVAELAFISGYSGKWFTSLSPMDESNVDTSFLSGIKMLRYDLTPAQMNNIDHGIDKPYQTLYFEYIVGKSYFEVLRLDGVDVTAKLQPNPFNPQDTTYLSIPKVPVANTRAAQDGINGFVISNTGSKSDKAFFDEFYMEIETPVNKAADLNKDGKIDMKDFAIFADEWLKCNDPINGLCI